jgi:hypothetical protein
VLIGSTAVGWHDKKLALALGVPLLSAEPATAALCTTQSGMKRVFQGTACVFMTFINNYIKLTCMLLLPLQVLLLR